jgi:hypothetical protein
MYDCVLTMQEGCKCTWERMKCLAVMSILQLLLKCIVRVCIVCEGNSLKHWLTQLVKLHIEEMYLLLVNQTMAAVMLLQVAKKKKKEVSNTGWGKLTSFFEK